MKVHVIKGKTIDDYGEQNRNSRKAFKIWSSIIAVADWQTPQDIIGTFGNADILGNGTDRTVFDIGGNNYRMICTYYFGKKFVHLYINWIGTHSEYDTICGNNLQYTIHKY